MQLTAALALQNLADDEVAEQIIDRIRYLLYDMDPNIHVAIDLQGVGIDFGGIPIERPSVIENLLRLADQRRRDLLHAYWLRRDGNLLQQSLRLGHAVASMNPMRIQRLIDLTDDDDFC